MATNFPTSLDTIPNVTDGVDYPEASDMNVLNDAVEALQAKVGIDDSAVATSIDYILKNKIYPIGTLYTNYSVATNPATLFGFGTWVAVTDEVLVGKASSGTFASIGSLGAETESVAHTHTGPSHTHGDAHVHGIEERWMEGSGGLSSEGGPDYLIRTNSQDNEDTDAGGTGNTGAMSANATASIIQPTRVVYMWRRTA
jgi:hypothetical protein